MGSDKVTVEVPETSERGSVIPESAPESLLERDLRNSLVRDLGNAFGQDLELIGAEVAVEVGRVDILAKDAAGSIWVVELKNKTCTRDVVGQVLSYVGATRKQYPGSLVRGVVVGPDFDDTALSALEATHDIVFFKFSVSYTLTEHATSPNLRPVPAKTELSSVKSWVIDVSKRLLFRRANASQPIELSSVHLIPGLGVALQDGFISFKVIELMGDGYAVGKFRQDVVNGEIPDLTLPSTRTGLDAA